MVGTPRGYWPWSPERIEEIGSDILRYFEAYYSELRSLIAQHDPDFHCLPLWLKGGRIVEINFCADGVLVVHHPYDADEKGFYPDKENTYEVGQRRGILVKDAVDAVAPGPRVGEERLNLPEILGLDYPDGGRFGNMWLRSPLQLPPVEMDDEHEVVEATSWTRLDSADLKSTGMWRDEEHAREDAREVIDQYR